MSAYEHWGTLSFDALESRRRRRTLGLDAAVRAFNEAAVPGTGGIWYAKQLSLAALGLHLAEVTGHHCSNIRVANGVEALACMLGLRALGAGERDARLLGRLKLAGKQPSDTFKTISEPGFYVNQPMRMRMTQPLVSLGFCEPNGSTRFNALNISEEGKAFLEASFSNGALQQVCRHLAKWIVGETNINDTTELRGALLPQALLPQPARDIFHNRLIAGVGGDRRHSIMRWIDSLEGVKKAPGWETRPPQLDASHWQDMRAGAMFFAIRAAAVVCLDAIEHALQDGSAGKISLADAAAHHAIGESLEAVGRAAGKFTALGHMTPNDDDARCFAAELTKGSPEEQLQCLVKRDGRVVTLSGDGIGRGPAFGPGARTNEMDDSPDQEEPQQLPFLPLDISGRVRNMAWLRLDLDGRLDPFVAISRASTGVAS